MEWPRNIPWTVLRKEYSMRYLTATYGRQVAQDFVRDHAHESDEELSKMALKVSSVGSPTGGPIDPHEAIVESLAIQDRIHPFVFSPLLCLALRETDTGKVDDEFLRLPFHWIYLDIGLEPIKVPDVTNLPKWANVNTEVRGVILTDTFPATAASGIMGYIVGYSPNTVDASTGLRAPWNLFPVPLKSIIEWNGDVFSPEGMANEEVALAFGQEVLRLIVNAILYVNCINADIREERLRNQTLSDPRGRVLARDVAGKPGEGGNVRRCGFYIRLPQVGTGGGGVETGRKIEVRFLVRGHFHRFWTGPRKGEGEQKLITRWVEPFWKGPDAAEQMHGKIYQVKEAL